jgi:ribonuclease T1
LQPTDSCHGNLAAAEFSRRFFYLHDFYASWLTPYGFRDLTLSSLPCDVEDKPLNSRKKGDKRLRQSGLFFGRGGLMRATGVFLLGTVFLSATGTLSARSPAIERAGVVRTADLPWEARETLALIAQGGPYPYSRDGAVFANREGRLPHASRGTYREYTVKTPGTRDRGARRIIAAGSNQFWYTADHYRSFRRIVE